MTIITLPLRYASPQGRQGSSGSPSELVPLPPAVRLFLSALEQAAKSGVPGEEAPVAALLATGLPGIDLASELPWRPGSVGLPALLDLGETRSCRIFARRWQPGQIGPLRRLMDWFALGVVAGRLTELDYAAGLDPSGEGGVGSLSQASSRCDLSRGEVRHGSGGGQRLWRLGNLSADVAVSLHVEGLPQTVAAAMPVLMPLAKPVSTIRPRPRLTVLPGGRAD